MVIQILNAEFKDQIVELRKNAFSSKYGSNVDTRGLEWDQNDANGIHFGALRSGELISLLRLTYHIRPEGFDLLLQFPATHEFSELPCFCLTRAATKVIEKNQSLNMNLRLAAYRHIKANPKQATAIFGTAIGNSKRIDFLKNLGYEFITNDRPWQGYLKSGNNSVSIFKMPLSKLEIAINKLEKRADL